MNIGNKVLVKLQQEISTLNWERCLKPLKYDIKGSRSNIA